MRNWAFMHIYAVFRSVCPEIKVRMPYRFFNGVGVYYGAKFSIYLYTNSSVYNSKPNYEVNGCVIKEICRKQGCNNLADKRYCEQHTHLNEYGQQRGSAAERGYDHKWRQARKIFLNQHPLCAECGRDGKLGEATEVDHIIPHRGDKYLFWDRMNWQGLCKSHQSRKTVKEDGGFGRKML